jgi:predicted dehydrogenase
MIRHQPLRPPGESERPASTPSIGIGVVGYGYWGPNLVRNFVEQPGARVVAIADQRQERLQQVAARYPTIGMTTDFQDLLNSSAIDAIAIATPSSTHFPLARQALLAGKHVLVEKPMATTSEDAYQLIELAEQRGLVLMVDHTFIYTGSVRKIRELVASGELGRLYYWDSVRVNLGIFQPDVSVLQDLAVHDLSIMDHVVGTVPAAVAATGMAHVPGRPVNTAYLTCYFEANLLAHFHVNWLSPVKVRRTLIGGDRRMVVYDDTEPSEKVKVYDSGITLAPTAGAAQTDAQKAELQIGYRAGDVWAPKLSLAEALSEEARHFLECIGQRGRPLTDGWAGWRLVRILEAASRSLSKQGQPVEIDWSPMEGRRDPTARPESAA